MKSTNVKIGVVFSLIFLNILSVSGQRIEIDRLDREFRGSYNSRKAYELSQKLIQLDSTYYIGHFYEAKYHFFRASDKRGYDAAIGSLEKTIELIEKNFPRKIRRSTDINVYLYRYEIQRRYVHLISHLKSSYQYVDRPGDAIKVLRRLQKRDFVCNFGVNVYAGLSWIYYRNRIYGPDKYDFLKPTIEENLEMASKFADSIKYSQRHNQSYLDNWWPNFANDELLSYYHYKDIILLHELKVDSAEYFSQELIKYDRLSYNNYGNLQFVQAKYPNAEESYQKARELDNYERKSTKEFDYMQSAIKIFQNDVATAKSIVEESIDYLGTSPGFGWNSIALSRAYYYAGDLKKSKEHRDQAANFKEVHINSTWGEVDYEQNTLLLEYLYHKKSMNEIMFRDRNYWYKPSKLYAIAKHYFKQENTHLLLTSEVSADPERFQVLYNLFASENTMFFDEVWELIKYFNPDYFINIFKGKLEDDEREKVHKYFDYFIAQFQLEDESYDAAIAKFEEVLQSEELDSANEKLLIARVHEGLSKAYAEKEDDAAADESLMAFYLNFPQLVPYSDLTMKFNLVVAKKTLSPDEQSIIDELKACNIEWVENDPKWPTLTINFSSNEEKKSVVYQVAINNKVKFEGVEELKEAENLGHALAFQAFGIELAPFD